MTKFFQFNCKDYNTSIPRIDQHHAYFTGKAIRMSVDETMIEYSNDQQILSLFFQMEVSKIQPEIIAPVPGPTKEQKVFDMVGAVVIIIGAIVAAIYFLN